jgi:hypothetical protein
MKKVKKMKVAKMMDLRIGICSIILNDTSNCWRNVVLNEAKKHHEKKLQKLAK